MPSLYLHVVIAVSIPELTSQSMRVNTVNQYQNWEFQRVGQYLVVHLRHGQSFKTMITLRVTYECDMFESGIPHYM